MGHTRAQGTKKNQAGGQHDPGSLHGNGMSGPRASFSGASTGT